MTQPLSLCIHPEALKPLVREIAAELLAQLESARSKVAGKLAFTEAEAAALLGLRQHQLRDERLRGRIAASLIVGNRVRYLESDLTGYLLARRVNDEAKAAA